MKKFDLQMFSYSLKRPCGNCTKKVQCLDSSFVMAAISGIHSVNYTDAQRQAHLGGGTIEIQCCSFVDERPLCSGCGKVVCECNIPNAPEGGEQSTEGTDPE